MHIYDYSDLDNPKLSDKTKLSDIRKSDSLYPSVTTILKTIPNPFLQEWVVNKCIEIGRRFPEMKDADIRSLAWGRVKSPEGEILSSAEFGTRCHYALETLFTGDISLENRVLGQGDSPYEEFVMEVYDDIINLGITDTQPEVLVCDHDLKIAGMIDLLAKKDGRFVLLDYKFRTCNGKGKFYDSDSYQLAIESFFIQQEYNLNYLPKICSICVDNVSGIGYFKWWTQKRLDRGIQIFLDARDLYFSINNID